MARKILGWLIFFLIAIFIGFLIWLFFFRTEPDNSSFSPSGRADDFFPVDTSENFGREGLPVDGVDTERRGRNFIPRLRKLSDTPTAGSVAFERPTGSSETFVSEDGVEETREASVTIFRYIERATGHLFEARENSQTQTRLSNTTVPKVYDALFAPDGDHVLLRILAEDGETVETLAATVTAKSTTSPETFQLVADGYSLEGSFLSPNTISADISENGLTYLIPNNKGGSSLITSDFDDLSKRIVFESPLQEWIVERISGNNASINTKADSRVDGFMYFVNLITGQSEKIIGELSGLTTLISPDEKWMVYSLSRENELDLFARNIDLGSTINLGLQTLPEKCAFGRDNNDILFCAAPSQIERVPYPESWYQGLVSFEDNLWRINLDTEEFDQVLGDREEVNQSFDITKLQVSPRDEFVLFVNKKDQTLWSLDVTTVER